MDRQAPCPNLRISKVLSASLVLFAAANFYVLVGNWLELQVAGDIIDGAAVHANRLDEIDSRSQYERLMFIGSWLSTAILFMFFYGRTLRVAQESGSQGMHYKSGWVFFSFFVPLASFVVPYRAMQEAWRATDAQADSYSWVEAKSSPLILIWWLQWLAAAICGYALPKFADMPDSPVAQYESLQRSIAFNLLFLTLTVTALLMVRAVSLRCLVKWEHKHGPSSAPKATVEQE